MTEGTGDDPWERTLAMRLRSLYGGVASADRRIHDAPERNQPLSAVTFKDAHLAAEVTACNGANGVAKTGERLRH